MNEQIQALKECAAIAEYHKHTNTANTARATTAALEALIEAALDFVYQTPWDGKNKEHEAIMSALHNLGYRYCEGCDRWTSTTKERDDLPGGVALCDECDRETRGHIAKQMNEEPEPIAYDQVEIDAQQREHNIEVDNVRDIMNTIEQGDIEAFLENKYKPSRYHLSE